MDRKPAVAGTFYSGNNEDLEEELTTLFSLAVPRKWNDVRAIIVPHAGYVFSGKVAASAFNQIPEDAEYDRIFIIGSSHYVAENIVSTYTQGNYKTPLGEVTVDSELITSLITACDFIKYLHQADAPEHCIEVQLPFLSHHLKRDFKIVPLIICTWSKTIIESLSKVLEPYFTKKNLFVISTDFSHYPSSLDATKIDLETADSICLNNKTAFHDTLTKHKHAGVSELITDLCGWTSVLCLLNITQDKSTVIYHKVDYANSGDSEFGDKSRVVGYYAIAITETVVEFSISDADKKTLLSISRIAIERYIKHKEVYVPDKSKLSKMLLEHCGAFVSLHKHGDLRGCIGHFGADTELCDVVINMAIESATQDYRFPPVTVNEIDSLEIELSVLSPMRKIASIDEFELGKHGIYIKKGNHVGTFLPQVADSTHWKKEEFLSHCSHDKAGLDWDGWKTADLYVYEAIVFKE